MREQAVTVSCPDGFALNVLLFESATPASRIVLLSPANGVPARFYTPFARWLATQGFTTATWDWRGLGQTAPASMRGFVADMTDWATKDQPTVLHWLHERFQLPMIGIGHSFGGQVFGLAGCPERFEKIILFGSSNAYWRLWPAPDRYAFRAAISIMRRATAVVGYLPGTKVGLGADLPAGVAREWLTWCLHPDYHQRWDGHGQITAPVISFAFSDDRYAPLVAREDLMQRYGGEKTLVTVTPREFGLKKVGHFDFFRSRNAPVLWPAFLPYVAR
ncbi:MAG: alpha/beta fold hydrolase [Woeseia sp.]|nr:alpha/beta fold hydrolase [Woeseia sp.]